MYQDVAFIKEMIREPKLFTLFLTLQFPLFDAH